MGSPRVGRHGGFWRGAACAAAAAAGAGRAAADFARTDAEGGGDLFGAGGREARRGVVGAVEGATGLQGAQRDGRSGIGWSDGVVRSTKVGCTPESIVGLQGPKSQDWAGAIFCVDGVVAVVMVMRSSKDRADGTCRSLVDARRQAKVGVDAVLRDFDLGFLETLFSHDGQIGAVATDAEEVRSRKKRVAQAQSGSEGK
ncbi:hypothetical protein L1887_48984 [Cichorium endivia]|nr:hypothetical protein L1887_48984 [Cichorium endivia]